MKWNVRIGIILVALLCMTGCGRVKKDVVLEDTYKGNVKDEVADDIIGEDEEAEVPVEEEKVILPTPLSGLYKDMVVEKMDYVPLPEDKKVAYITFDDGPCKSTPQLLEVLRKLNVKATFFVSAQYGSDEEVVEWLKQIKADGHEIGVHSYSHRYNEIYSSVKNYLKDFKKMDDLIVKATGEHARLFRFPGGSNTGYNASIREDIIKEMTSRGMVYYDWNAYNGDCDGFSKSEMIAKAVKESSYRNKSIVLMHNIPKKDLVIESLPSIVKELSEKGYVFEALDGTVEPIQFVKVSEIVPVEEETTEEEATEAENAKENEAEQNTAKERV